MNDSENRREIQIVQPTFRIWTCGAFLVERGNGTPVPVKDWGGSQDARRLLKKLLCSSGRTARREEALEALWPDGDPAEVGDRLSDAAYHLRKVLKPAPQAESLLLAPDKGGYRLPGQAVLWVDADAALARLSEAEPLGGSSARALPLLQDAVTFLNRGLFLEEEEGQWATGRRATLERARYRSRLWLAELCAQQGMPGQAETVLSQLLEEDSTDEDVLARLMRLLRRQGMIHQALRYYHAFTEVAQREGLEPTEVIKNLAAQLREERHSLQHIAVSPIYNPTHALAPETFDGVQHFLEIPKPLTFPTNLLTDHSGPLELSNPTTTSLSIPSLFRTDNDVLVHLSTVLSKSSLVGEREIDYFDQQTRLYWRAREETALPATTLYGYVIRHIDDITSLFARSHTSMLRSYLCEIVCRTVLLAGILLYDMGQYAKSRQQYQVAFQAATEANNVVLQAIVWGWMSFTWTYAKHYTEALGCVQHARFFAMQTTDIIVQAWLGAIEAEVQAHLHNRDASLRALSNMERGMGVSPSQDTSYLFEFNPVLLLGYKGVCLQQFYQRQTPATHGLLQQAKEALEQALASEAPLKRKLYYLSDLAGVYARQGEVEAACAYVAQSIPLIMQVGSGSKTIRKHLLQVRVLLQPNEHTSSVQALDEQMAPLLLEMQTAEV